MKKTNIARLAVTAGLTLAMGAGMMAPATVAFADPTYGKGSITISKVENSDYTQKFVGYQIFKANVSDDNTATNTTSKKETNVQWVNDEVKAAVEGVINQNEQGYAGTTAQDAADWIVNHVHYTNNTTHVEGTSIPHQIAEAVKNASSTATKLEAGKAAQLDEGYWVFMKDPDSSMANDESGTAPIFAVVGDGAVTVTEKVGTDTIPTPGKKLVDPDSTTHDTDNSGSVARGDTLTYELSAKLPSNLMDYKSYTLKFTDTLSAGLTYQENVQNYKLVRKDGSEIALTAAPSVVQGDSAQVHTFTYANLFEVLPANYQYKAGDKIVFQYGARVANDAQAGQDLSNAVSLTYSNDPNSTGTGTSTDTPKVHEYTYKLVLNKVDLGTEETIPSGAKFTVYSQKDKQYIKADGTKTADAEAAKIEVQNGTLTVEGLDAGKYTVTEVEAPTGYDAAASFDIDIEPSFYTSGENNGQIESLTNTMTERDDLIGGTIDTSSEKGDNKLTAAANTATNANAGTVTVTVGDRKQITMPLTGMKGTTALMVYGSAILVISAAAYLKHKRNAENDDAE